MRYVSLIGLIPLVALLPACDDVPDEVRLRGAVFAGPESTDRLGGATLASFDVAGAEFGRATADGEGLFELPAPVGNTTYIDVEAEGYVRTSFTGVTGIDDELLVDDGLVYGVSEARFDEWAGRFEGCPGIGEGGATFGEVRISNLKEPGTGVHPLVTTAVVTLEGPDGEVLDACYLDEEGAVFDPEAEATGASGRYAIFGAPPGEHLLVVAYETGDGVWSSDAYPVRITEGGVAPMFPLWTDFEL